jgi:hypothetical protein
MVDDEKLKNQGRQFRKRQSCHGTAVRTKPRGHANVDPNSGGRAAVKGKGSRLEDDESKGH